MLRGAEGRGIKADATFSMRSSSTRTPNCSYTVLSTPSTSQRDDPTTRVFRGHRSAATQRCRERSETPRFAELHWRLIETVKVALTKTRGRNLFHGRASARQAFRTVVPSRQCGSLESPCALRRIHPDESIPNDGRAKVADMHLLCHIRSGVIDHHSSWLSTLMQPKMLVVCDFAQQVIDGAISKGDVDKPRSCDLKRGAEIVKLT